jgi:DNA-directed RNA polymerase sigma subunit (sigma70/sigma32)
LIAFATTLPARGADKRSGAGGLASVEATKRRVNRVSEEVDPRERHIIGMRAGAIGHQLGIPKARGGQLEVGIVNKLRAIATEQDLDLA